VSEVPATLHTVTLAEVEMQSIIWVEKPLILSSAFTVIAGPTGVGKGTWLAGEIAKMTTGGYEGRPPRNVLIVASEDSAEIDLKPRAKAAGADMARVHVVREHFLLPRDEGKLYRTAVEIGDVGMIVIDPIGNHLGGADTEKEGAVRNALAGLNRLADKLECVVFGVRHLTKSRIDGALAAVLGSGAFAALPRAVLMFAPDDEDEMMFHVQVVKGNRSGRGAGRQYRIELADVGLLEPVTKVVPAGESRKDIDDLLVTQRRPSNTQTARNLLLTILENDGDQESDALDARVAHEAQIAAKTVKNLRTKLGPKGEGLIKSYPIPTEDGQPKVWYVGRTHAPLP
jgi:hypothetical protein